MIKILLVLNVLPMLGLTCFESNCIDKNGMSSEMKIMQCIQNDVIRIVHCALNIELAQSVVILTFELAL